MVAREIGEVIQRSWWTSRLGKTQNSTLDDVDSADMYLRMHRASHMRADVSMSLFVASKATSVVLHHIMMTISRNPLDLSIIRT